jgi:phosphoglycerate dehydrogenase-like enzyme
LVAESDVVAVCARADASNKHLLSREILSAMQPHAVLVNVARGQLVDEDALLDLLRSRKIGGAGLDVFELEPTPASRWINVPNVVVTPHIGGATRQSVSGMNAMLVENLDRFFRGEPVATPVPE